MQYHLSCCRHRNANLAGGAYGHVQLDVSSHCGTARKYKQDGRKDEKGEVKDIYYP